MRRNLHLIAGLLGLATAKPLQSRYVLKETHPVPPEYTRESDAPADHLMRLSIGLTQSRFDELEEHLYEVSDPHHHRYGQHLTADEVHELVKPSDEALELVEEWLKEHIELTSAEYSPAKDFISFTIPVAKVEKLLDTKYSVYRHDDGSSMVRTPDWKLPMHLHPHIDSVQPTNAFLRPLPQAKTFISAPSPDLQAYPHPPHPHGKPPTIESVCHKGSVTPLCLRTLYGTVEYKPRVPGKNQVALTDYLGEINNRSDAKIYLEHFRPGAVKAAEEFKQVSVNGGTLQQTPETPKQLAAGTGLEGNLDVQTILGISYPTPLTAYSTNGTPPFIPDKDNPTVDNEPYMIWLNYILKQNFIPQVVSNSYEDDEQTVPKSYATAVCRQFAQLGARGVSVIFGSGDGGVSGVQPGGPCESNVDHKRAFVPLFPSSCPYVTSVGATVNFQPEVVAFDPANNFSSGGGFSNYFKQPSYQAEAVAGYLAKIDNEFSNLYNKSGRAYPDLAAYGVNFTIAWNGTLLNLDGTSASTPTAASVFALLNDALLANGKPVLGFLNPWLYKKGKEAFVDVTSGSALGCGTTGFRAVKGWDAVSGFGTPRFDKLLEAVGLSHWSQWDH